MIIIVEKCNKAEKMELAMTSVLNEQVVVIRVIVAAHTLLIVKT